VLSENDGGGGCWYIVSDACFERMVPKPYQNNTGCFLFYRDSDHGGWWEAWLAIGGKFWAMGKGKRGCELSAYTREIPNTCDSFPCQGGPWSGLRGGRY